MRRSIQSIAGWFFFYSWSASDSTSKSSMPTFKASAIFRIVIWWVCGGICSLLTNVCMDLYSISTSLANRQMLQPSLSGKVGMLFRLTVSRDQGISLNATQSTTFLSGCYCLHNGAVYLANSLSKDGDDGHETTSEKYVRGEDG